MRMLPNPASAGFRTPSERENRHTLQSNRFGMVLGNYLFIFPVTSLFTGGSVDPPTNSNVSCLCFHQTPNDSSLHMSQITWNVLVIVNDSLIALCFIHWTIPSLTRELLCAKLCVCIDKRRLTQDNFEYCLSATNILLVERTADINERNSRRLIAMFSISVDGDFNEAPFLVRTTKENANGKSWPGPRMTTNLNEATVRKSFEISD